LYFKPAKYILFSGLLLILNISPAEAQLLKDTSTLNIIKKDIDYIYNLQFSKARELYSEIVKAYPDHPVIYLLRGMITYWGNYPLLNTSAAKDSFESDLRECIKHSENNRNPGFEAEYLLANLCARGFLLMFYSDNDLVMEVIPLTSSTYANLRRSFDFTSQSTDLLYFTGMYNYYRDAYPKAFPVYKPLAMLFPSGDMKKGIEELNTAAENSVVLGAESTYLLSYIYVNFENDFLLAYKYSSSLHEKYPENVHFFTFFLRNLLLLKRYDEADKLIGSMPAEPENRYFKAQLYIFKGIIMEKKYLNNKAAQECYHKGISEISLFGDYGNEYAAYGYFGLSRISEADGKKHESQMYRKEALKLSDFRKINFDK
jgi:hypothetical protein